MGNGITRRAAFAGIAGLALAGFAGCSAQETEAGASAGAAWAGGYLPIGSAVRLEGMPEGFEHVVVSRRPAHAGAGGVRDYALVQAVLGITSDLSGGSGLYEGEVVLADESDIAEVLSVGRMTEEESRAEQLLADGRGSAKTGIELLLPLVEERAGKLGGGNAGN